MRIHTSTFRLGAAIVASSLILATAACGGEGGDDPGGTSSKTIKIGALMDFTKTYAGLGNPTLAGLRTYIKKVNDAGGVNGAQIEIETQDTRADAATARTGAQKLISDGDRIIFGPLDSTSLVAVAPLIAQGKVPNFSSAALTQLHKPAQPYLFTTQIRVADHAVIAARWMKDRAAAQSLTNPKVAVLTIDTPAVQELRDGLAQSIPAVTGGTVVFNDKVAATASDMATAAQPIINAKPDFIQVGLLPTQLPGFIKALRQHGINAPVMTYFLGSDESIFKAINDPNYFAARTYADPNDTSNPKVDEMKADAEKAGQTQYVTSQWFTFGYVTAQLFVEAFKKCGVDCANEALNTAFEQITKFDAGGLSGSLGVSAPADHLFVKQARVYVWDPATSKSKADGDWISA